MIRVNTNIAVPIENIWPNNLTVAKVLPATPKYLFSTELMMAFIFGLENTAKPNPINSNPKIK